MFIVTFNSLLRDQFLMRRLKRIEEGDLSILSCEIRVWGCLFLAVASLAIVLSILSCEISRALDFPANLFPIGYFQFSLARSADYSGLARGV